MAKTKNTNKESKTPVKKKVTVQAVETLEKPAAIPVVDTVAEKVKKEVH